MDLRYGFESVKMIIRDWKTNRDTSLAFGWFMFSKTMVASINEVMSTNPI
jgi:uncharacterized membrane protein